MKQWMKKSMAAALVAVGCLMIVGGLFFGVGPDPVEAQTTYGGSSPLTLIASEDILGAEVATQTATTATIVMGQEATLVVQAIVSGISAASTNAITLSFDEAVGRTDYIVGTKTNAVWKSGTRTMTVTPLGTTTVNVISNFTAVAPRIRLYKVTGDAVNSNVYLRVQAITRE